MTTLDLCDGHRDPSSRLARPYLFRDIDTGERGTLDHFLRRCDYDVDFVRREMPEETWGPGEYTACRLVQALAGLEFLPWTLSPSIAARIGGKERLADVRIAHCGGSGDPSSNSVWERGRDGGGIMRLPSLPEEAQS